ncbi:MAG: hypothetical protein ACT7A5_04040 [Ferrovibrionaceae bacterium]
MTTQVDEMFARIFGSAPSRTPAAAATARSSSMPRSRRCTGCGLEQPAIVPECLQCGRPA